MEEDEHLICVVIIVAPNGTRMGVTDTLDEVRGGYPTSRVFCQIEFTTATVRQVKQLFAEVAYGASLWIFIDLRRKEESGA